MQQQQLQQEEEHQVQQQHQNTPGGGTHLCDLGVEGALENEVAILVLDLDVAHDLAHLVADLLVLLLFGAGQGQGGQAVGVKVI